MFRITRAVEGGTVAQWNMQQHQHLPTNSLFLELESAPFRVVTTRICSLESLVKRKSK